MPSSTLPGVGLQWDWNEHESGWKNGVDSNWKKIDTLLKNAFKGKAATASGLPASPANGDAYLVTATNQVAVYLNGSWEYMAVSAPSAWFDASGNDWCFFDGVTWTNYSTIIASLFGINGLDDLSDVNAAAPASGDFLQWNGTAWVPAAYVHNLEDHGNVDTTGVILNDVLQFNGTQWVSGSIAFALDDLSDISAAGATNGQILQFNGTSWVAATYMQSLDDHTDVVAPAPTVGQVLSFDGSNWVPSTAAAAGESNTASNVGTGTGQVFKQKTGTDLELKTILAGSTNVTVVNNSDEIVIDVVGGALGEVNTGSNSGTAGASVFNTKVATDLQFYAVDGVRGLKEVLNGTTNAVEIELDVNSLVDGTSGLDTAADFILVYDASAADHKKVLVSSLGGIPAAATAPAGPVAGDLWKDTSTAPPTLKCYDGTTWNTVGGIFTASNINTGTGVGVFDNTAANDHKFRGIFGKTGIKASLNGTTNEIEVEQDYNTLTDIGSGNVDPAADFIPVYDASAGTYLKVKPEELGGGSAVDPYADDATATTGIGTPVLGDMYYDTTLKVLKHFDGSAWVVINNHVDHKNTKAAPLAVAAGTAIATDADETNHEVIYVSGTGGVTTTAIPALSAGNATHAKLITLIGTSDTDFVLIPEDPALSGLRGMEQDALLTENTSITFMWCPDVSEYVEIARSNGEELQRKFVYEFSGVDQPITVPAWASEMRVKAWGAGTGGLHNNYTTLSTLAGGAAGGYTEAIMPIGSGGSPINPGDTLIGMVGEGGGTAGDATTSNLALPAAQYGFSGEGFVDSIFNAGNSFEGGGLTGLFKTSVTQANAIVVAGGGGGPSLFNTSSGPNYTSGLGEAGNAAGGSTNANPMKGDDLALTRGAPNETSGVYGSTSGGGYTGGAVQQQVLRRGLDNTSAYGSYAGLGGSGFVDATATFSSINKPSDFSRETVNILDSDYVAVSSYTPGQGGVARATHGGHGLLVIEFY